MTQALTMRIRMNVDGVPIAATLHDNETARDFISLLPLTLTLSDYASAEKISDLPRRLSTRERPRAPTRRLATSPTTRHGETWPCSTEPQGTREAS